MTNNKYFQSTILKILEKKFNVLFTYRLQMQKNDNSVKPLPHNLPVSADKDQSESKNDLKNVKDRIQRPWYICLPLKI